MFVENRGLLDAIRDEQIAAGEGVPGPASQHAVDGAADYLCDAFGVALPPALADLWSVRGGVDFNGMVIYGPEEGASDQRTFRASNETFREQSGTRYVHIGEGDMDVFVLDTESESWDVVDCVSMDVNETFGTCEALLRWVLEKYLEA